ncbi:MAG: hypothetical protein PVF17_00990 [Ignavibacteria bacterium]|jgi:hypothetical protein
MGTFKIDDKTAKTTLVGADIFLIGDSEDLSGSDKKLKKSALSNMLSYMQNNLSFAARSVKYLTNTDSPFTITDSDGYTTFICDTSGGDIDIILPTLADNQARNLEFIHQVGGGLLTIDGEGAETIDGMTEIELPKQYDRMTILGTTVEWAILEERISCQLRLDTYAGYGSTDTKIMRFTNSRENYGNMFGENHSTGYNGNTEGLEIIANKPGKYSFEFSLSSRAGSPDPVAISLNSTQLTTSVITIAASDRLAIDYAAGGTSASVSVSLFLAKNDIIRAHTNGNSPDTAAWCNFIATYIGN